MKKIYALVLLLLVCSFSTACFTKISDYDKVAMIDKERGIVFLSMNGYENYVGEVKICIVENLMLLEQIKVGDQFSCPKRNNVHNITHNSLKKFNDRVIVNQNDE